MMALVITAFVVLLHCTGDPTDNARDFVAWLKQEQSPEILSKLRFAVFGLGNRQYEHFNSQGVAAFSMLYMRTKTIVAHMTCTFAFCCM